MSTSASYSVAAPQPASSSPPPRILIVGAGSRGNAYARAIQKSTNGTVVSVAEPVAFKRQEFGRKYVWGDGISEDGQEFEDWKDFLEWEQTRREKAARGDPVPAGVDGVFVCTLDTMHAEIIIRLAPLDLHIMSEKPLATTLQDCVHIYQSLLARSSNRQLASLFAVGHVLRGHWRKESTTAPSLLTKSCHDIDLLLWFLCSSPPHAKSAPHMPKTVTSEGSLKYFKRSRKPVLAGNATNCLTCAAEKLCQYSTRKIYQQPLRKGHIGFPVKIVVPEVEDLVMNRGVKAAEETLLGRLGEDYSETLTQGDIDARPWFGRCVYESANDVCDDQVVTMTWEDDPSHEDVSMNSMPAEQESNGMEDMMRGRGAKTAIFHMVAFTEKVCERRSRIYGTKGEIETDSKTIRVHDFSTSETPIHHPYQAGGGHGGGDDGLARQFLFAIDAVKNGKLSVEQAQMEHIGCTLEDVIRSHAMVFAAEDARTSGQAVDWQTWWDREVEERLKTCRAT
ncbi:MAG: hypothetical protein M1817_000026 [Caeruleum heppii]|nr:MAG: hypothetical protein M1817_000026 [Caeruleum heppii]